VALVYFVIVSVVNNCKALRTPVRKGARFINVSYYYYYYYYYYFRLSECKKDPPTVSSASLAVAVTHEIGHSVSYTCDSGLEASGNAISTCLMSGQWSQPDFSCQRKIRRTKLEIRMSN